MQNAWKENAANVNIMINVSKMKGENMKKYLKAKQRAKIVLNNNNVSDYEIIEYLENEIEYYRNKIRKMQDRNIQYETTTEKYADGRLIQKIIDYKYSE